MPCHTSTAGVKPTVTQVEYDCKQRNEIILFLFRYRQAEAQDAHAALARDRSMRGERRGFLIDRGLLRHGRRGVVVSSHSIGSSLRVIARASTSSMRETGTMSRPFLMLSLISTRSLAFSSGM